MASSSKDDLSRLAKKMFREQHTLAELGINTTTIRELKDAGYRVSSQETAIGRVYYLIHALENASYFISGNPKGPLKYKWMEVSDIHAGSIQFDDIGLTSVLKRAHDDGVEEVHIAGDLCDGYRMYPGHMTNLRYWKSDDQASQLFEILVQFPFSYYACKGNHDFSYEKEGSPNPVSLIEIKMKEAGKNFMFLNCYAGDLVIGGVLNRIVHLDGGAAYARCFDDQTELYTKRGFVPASDVTMDDEMATLGNGGVLEWQKPTSLVRQYHNDEMIHFKSRTIDCMVTPNHRMLVRRTPSKVYALVGKSREQRDFPEAWRELTAGELCDGHVRQKYSFRQTFLWNGAPSGVNRDMIELLCWYATEGCVIAKKGKAARRVCLSQNLEANPGNYRRIQELVQRLGHTPHRDTAGRSIVFTSVETVDWLTANCGRGSYHKFLPEWLKNETAETIRFALSILIAGDGWRGGPNGSFGYKSFSRQLLEDVYELCLKAGYAPTMSPDKRSVYVGVEQMEPALTKQPTRVPYSGFVYCANVPNETLLARRNGRCVWTFNSYPGQRYIRNLLDAHGENVYIGGNKYRIRFIQFGHLHTALDYEAAGIQCTHSGNYQFPNDYTIRRGLVGDQGSRFCECIIENGKVYEYVSRFVKPKR